MRQRAVRQKHPQLRPGFLSPATQSGPDGRSPRVWGKFPRWRFCVGGGLFLPMSLN